MAICYPCNRPGQALGVPGGWSSHISRQSAHAGSKVVSPTHQSSVRIRKYFWYSFVRGWVDTGATVRPEGLSMKNSNDTIGNRSRDLPPKSGLHLY